PCHYGRDVDGAAAGAYFRREEGAFLSGHYLVAEVASPAGERCGWRILRLIGAVRHGVRFSHRRGLWFILTALVGARSRASSPRPGAEVSEFSPPLWPWRSEPTADPAGQAPSPDPEPPEANRRFLGRYFETSCCSLV